MYVCTSQGKNILKFMGKVLIEEVIKRINIYFPNSLQLV